MNKFFSVLAIIFVFSCSSYAQTVVSSNYGSNSIAAKGDVLESDDTNSSSEKSWMDYAFSINTKYKAYGMMVGGNGSGIGYYNIGISFSTGDYASSSSSFGYGVHYRYDSGVFMILAAAYPYIGISFTQVPKQGSSEKETKTKFAWGAAANIRAGIKLYTTKKGTDGYLTFGYFMSAPELETKGMLDHGTWNFGLSCGI